MFRIHLAASRLLGRIVRLAPWLLLFVASVLAAKAVLEWADESAFVAVEPDRADWVKCPDRKRVGRGASRATWYCAPDHPEVLAASERSRGRH